MFLIEKYQGAKIILFLLTKLVESTLHPTNYKPLTIFPPNKTNITLFYYSARSIAYTFVRPFG